MIEEHVRENIREQLGASEEAQNTTSGTKKAKKKKKVVKVQGDTSVQDKLQMEMPQ